MARRGTTTNMVHFSVGGHAMSVGRETLLQAPRGSFLHSVARDPLDASLVHTSEGQIFLDHSSHSFAIIIDYLRTKSITKGPLPAPVATSERAQAFCALVEDLGLGFLMYGCVAAQCLLMRPRVSAGTDDDGSAALRVSMHRDGCAVYHSGFYVSEEPLRDTVSVWKLLVGAEVGAWGNVRLGVEATHDDEDDPEARFIRSSSLSKNLREARPSFGSGDRAFMRLSYPTRDERRFLQLFHMSSGAIQKVRYLGDTISLVHEEELELAPWRILVEVGHRSDELEAIRVCTPTVAEAFTLEMLRPSVPRVWARTG